MAEVQVVKGTSAIVIETFANQDGPIDLDSGVPTVTALFPDGTALTPAPTATKVPDTTGQYQVGFDAQDEVTYLDPITWTGAIGGKTQKLYSRVEWIGASLFTISEFRGLRVANGLPFAANATPLFTTAQIQKKRTAVLDELQTILGFPPVPRFIQEEHDGYDNPIIVDYRVRPRLLSIRVGGVDQSISGYYLNPHGVLRSVANYLPGPAFPYGYGNVEVDYVAGWLRPLGECSDAAMIWVAKSLNPSGFTNATTISTPDGATYTYERRGGFTGVADLDRWLERHRAVAGVA
jgi:hypothetical protein